MSNTQNDSYLALLAMVQELGELTARLPVQLAALAQEQGFAIQDSAQSQAMIDTFGGLGALASYMPLRMLELSIDSGRVQVVDEQSKALYQSIMAVLTKAREAQEEPVKEEV